VLVNRVITLVVEEMLQIYLPAKKKAILKSSFEKNEMGWACIAYGGEERCIQGFGGET